jgi:transposase
LESICSCPEAPISPFQQLLSPDLHHLDLHSVVIGEDSIVVTLIAVGSRVRCPCCDQPATRIHSYYWRRLTDLPIHGVPVLLRVWARRFFCRTHGCLRRIFAERLEGVATAGGRKTRRLRASLREVALADGGEGGARLARRLGMGTSPDTFLRLIRAAPPISPATPRVIGVDDWAKRKGRTYGAIIVDLERREVVDLLEDATAEAFRDWLIAHPGVEVISRDRGGAFADGARQGAPEATQVADRWHLLRNLGDTVAVFLKRIHRQLPPAATPGQASAPAERPSATRRVARDEVEHQRRRARRVERYELVMALRRQGLSARRIAAALSLSRMTVQRYLRADGFPELVPRAKRPSHLDPYRPYLEERWAAGCRNGRQLLRELAERGFAGKRGILADALTALRRREARPDEAAVQAVVAQAPLKRESARTVRWWMVSERDALEEEQRTALGRFLAEHAEASLVYGLAQEFGQIVRKRRGGDLAAWLERAREGPRELRTFVGGIERDRAAVYAALTEAWSQGQTEGQIHRLKLIRRKMYGRGHLDLLRRRMLEAA